MELNYPEKNSKIVADIIEVGKDFSVGHNVDIKVRGTFKVGDYSRFGNDVTINAENVIIGDHFLHMTPGLKVGGGGSQFKDANLTIGDRCVIHNNYLNLAMAITLGNDVGLSPDVDFLTHGFWESMLEGFPVKYGKIDIGDHVIIGQRSFIMMDVSIAPYSVIGANSTVTKSLNIPRAIYAGNPARLIREIAEPSLITKKNMFNNILEKYVAIARPKQIEIRYPEIFLGDVYINVETKTIFGKENLESDKLRDFLRRFGIKIYSARPFQSL